MNMRRHVGEWVLVVPPGGSTPEPALIQSPGGEPDPCFDCPDGACCVWPVTWPSLTHVTTPSSRPRLRLVGECQMRSVPKTFTGIPA